MTRRTSSMLAAEALDAEPFTAGQCDALFAAVLIDDAVDHHTELPPIARLDYSQAELVACFRICRQLWKTGVRRDVLLDLTRKLARDYDLGVEDRLLFKDVRAKFKHLRFAFALYGDEHRYPTLLDWITTEMGHLQDAFRHGRGAAVARHAALFRMLLGRVPYGLLEREIDRLQPTDGAGFRRYLEAEVARLAAVLEEGAVTGEQFHATRKIISRMVSFQGSLSTIASSADALLTSRYLSAINGLMGQMHDRLIERRDAGLQDYHREAFILPDEIRDRLTELVAWYRTGSAWPVPVSSKPAARPWMSGA